MWNSGRAKQISGLVHTAPFLIVSVFVAAKLPVHIAPFLYLNRVKNIRFCPLTLNRLIKRKTSVFVRSHCSAFVKLVIAYCLDVAVVAAYSKTSVFVRSH